MNIHVMDLHEVARTAKVITRQAEETTESIRELSNRIDELSKAMALVFERKDDGRKH